jgi:outer membrane protein assembly factor BamB
MARRFALAWVVAILAATAARAQIPISRDLLPTRSALARLGLERHWMTLVPIVGPERLTSISMSKDLVFAQTNSANFYAFEAESGRLLWEASLGRRSGTTLPASVNSRLVFVTNSNQLYALDRFTGALVWVVDLLTLPSSGTACDEHQVMVGLNSGKLVSYQLYDALDKRKVLYSTPRSNWNWQTSGGPLTSRPLPAEQFVAFGGRDGRLYVSLAELPTDLIPVMLYRIATGGEIFAPVGSYGDRTLLVPSGDKNLYAVDLFGASVKWVYPSGSPVLQEPLVADDDVYTVNTAGLLTALDAKTGSPLWTTSTHGGRLMSVSKSRVYLESHDEDLFIVDRRTGQILADPRATFERAGLNIREYALGFTNNQNDRIYIATRSGLLFCLREIGQLQPRPLRDPKLPPLGQVPPGGALPTPAQAVPPPAGAEPGVPAAPAENPAPGFGP